MVVEQMHNYSARHLETVPVKEVFRGQTAWEGEVEVFEIKGNPNATRAYAWSHLDGADDSDERFVAVLGVPPVDSPHRAVQVSIVADAKKGK
jgi:hypothetical protein